MPNQNNTNYDRFIKCSHCGGSFSGSDTQRWNFRRGMRVYCKDECRKSHGRPKRDLLERLMSRVDRNGPVPAKCPERGPCWLSGWGKDGKGYGKIGVGWVKRLVHVVSYEIHRGPVPSGLELHHVCENPGCCNPWHLEAVTHRENVLFGNAPAAIHARKTECVHGHPFTPENTYVNKKGQRSCRTCWRLNARRKSCVGKLE